MKLVRHCKALHFASIIIVVLIEHCNADRYDTRRDLHSEVQGLAAFMLPKKSLRPLTLVGALGAIL